MNYLKVVINNFKDDDSLLVRASRAASWTMIGDMVSQALRLGGNLILTRLLFPEAFGLMAIVQSILIGIALVSDIGVESSIIRSENGSRPSFLNTAWTMQILKGVFIWIVICMLAPIAASFYQEPMIANLMPIVGFSSVIAGFVSTKYHLALRKMLLKKRILIEVGSYMFGLAVTVVWAWIDHSIWSLVWGGLLGAFVKVAASYYLMEGAANKICWDRDSVTELFDFGQWVFVSSILTFLAGEGNKLLLGMFLGVKLLAFFTLASTMSLMYWVTVQKLSAKVLFPAYSEIVRKRPEQLRIVSAKSRLFLIIPGWFVALFFVLWGDRFMWFLYDERYADSGNMLRLLAAGSLVGVLGASYNGLLWAKGMVKTSTILLAVQILTQVVLFIVSYHFLGVQGVLLSVPTVAWLLYPLQAYVHFRVGLWTPKIDLPFIALSVYVVALNFNAIINNGWS